MCVNDRILLKKSLILEGKALRTPSSRVFGDPRKSSDMNGSSRKNPGNVTKKIHAFDAKNYEYKL